MKIGLALWLHSGTAGGPPAPSGPPVNLIAPITSGVAQIGMVISVTDGTWSGELPMSFTYQWVRPNGSSIAGATSNTYTPTADIVGLQVYCTVTATNAVGSHSVTSNYTAIVSGPPENTVRPVVSGALEVGMSLNGSTGSWQGYPEPTYARAWLRDGVVIPAQFGNSYTLTEDDLGALISFRVTGTNTLGVVPATSLEVGPIVAAGIAPENTVAPVASGIIQVGAALESTSGTWTGDPTPTFTYQWQRNGVNISGADWYIYHIEVEDALTNLRCIVTGTNSAGTATAISNVISVPATPPENISPPFVTGAAIISGTLESTVGDWSGAPPPDLIVYWESSPDGTNDWATITGAEGAYLVVTAAMAGRYIRSAVAAINDAGNSNSWSNVMGPVM